MTAPSIERVTVTMPTPMVQLIKEAVAEGGYASTSEVIREAMRDWEIKRALHLQEFARLKADIDRGVADLAEGRTQDFDLARIIKRGRALLARR